MDPVSLWTDPAPTQQLLVESLALGQGWTPGKIHPRWHMLPSEAAASLLLLNCPSTPGFFPGLRGIHVAPPPDTSKAFLIDAVTRLDQDFQVSPTLVQNSLWWWALSCRISQNGAQEERRLCHILSILSPTEKWSEFDPNHLKILRAHKLASWWDSHPTPDPGPAHLWVRNETLRILLDSHVQAGLFGMIANNILNRRGVSSHNHQDCLPLFGKSDQNCHHLTSWLAHTSLRPALRWNFLWSLPFAVDAIWDFLKTTRSNPPKEIEKLWTMDEPIDEDMDFVIAQRLMHCAWTALGDGDTEIPARPTHIFEGYDLMYAKIQSCVLKNAASLVHQSDEEDTPRRM